MFRIVFNSIGSGFCCYFVRNLKTIKTHLPMLLFLHFIVFLPTDIPEEPQILRKYILIKALDYIFKGLMIGLGFTISVSVILYIFNYFNSFDNKSYNVSQDSSQVETLKTLIENLPDHSTDLCKGMEGTWYGSAVMDDGTMIYDWKVTYHKSGKLERKIVSKTITNEEIELQKGNWECNKSILLNDLVIDGENIKHNYLILHLDDNERTYVHIGPYKLDKIFTSYKRRL